MEVGGVRFDLEDATEPNFALQLGLMVLLEGIEMVTLLANAPDDPQQATFGSGPKLTMCDSWLDDGEIGTAMAEADALECIGK